jgi:hypothetical protein
LDYGVAATPELLKNISGIAAIGEYIWTVSDEGRTVECLKRTNTGYDFIRQIVLDDFVPNIPAIEKTAELDLESIDIHDGVMWLCGSHCRVRKKPKSDDKLSPEFRTRPSRHFLAALDLSNDGGQVKRAKALPFEGHGSLRDVVEQNPFLRPFLELPSKENGFDIEGLLIRDDALLLGLRGPLIDNIAVVLNLSVDRDLAIKDNWLSFVDLGGLAVRDLARCRSGVLILAGPVNDALGPFRLYFWEPQTTQSVQKPNEIARWPLGDEKPEGLTELMWNDQLGVGLLYDHLDEEVRIKGSKITADWLPIELLL